MSTNPNIQALLGKSLGEVERPKAKPAGKYVLQVESAKLVESSQKKTPGVEITFNFVSAHESIDPELLKDVKLAGTQIRDTFYLTENSLYRFVGAPKEGVDGFVQHCGVATQPTDTVLEIINRLPGSMVLAEIAQELSRSGDSFFNKITGYSKLA